MMNINKIKEILDKLVGDSDLSRFEVVIGNGVKTDFGVIVDESANGSFVKITLYYECDVPDDIMGCDTQELIYRSFVIGPDRTLYRFDGSDGESSYYSPGGFGGFSTTEKLYIINIMNYVERGDE